MHYSLVPPLAACKQAAASPLPDPTLQAQGVAAQRAESKGTSPALVAALHRGTAGKGATANVHMQGSADFGACCTNPSFIFLSYVTFLFYKLL